ncbi:MAG: DUF4349 domain-containing protein [Minicystis sp.]
MAAPARADVAPAAPAPAAPPPPSPSPADASRGYAPPSAPPGANREPAPEALNLPATFQQPAPAPEAAPAPAAAPRPATRTAQAKGAPPPAKAPPPPPPAKAPPPPPAQKAPVKPAPDTHAPGPAAAPMLIYVGDLQMSVDEAEMAPTLDKVIDIAESLGGYLAGRKDTSVQVRIPSHRFREGLTRVEKLGDVLHRSVTADDVSEQYSDLEGRLLNLKATRQRLQEFLARSGSMADMLQVGRELERVAAEIEQIEGKMRYLRSRAAFSLITVAVQAKPKQIVKIADSPPPPPPPRDVELPIGWLSRVGLDRLLNLTSR